MTDHPTYASARNNRAQLVRLRHGDTILVQPSPSGATDDRLTVAQYARVALADLDTAIVLLTPQTPNARISPAARRTLAQAHTQRAALYHAAAKGLDAASADSTSASTETISSDSAMQSSTVKVDVAVEDLQSWTSTDFEEAASRDFQMGGRYGNEIGRVLGVAVNPTAKLCGAMVREAMRREYGPAL